ncbi:hypothetical protein [Parapedobacter tibetensis]|uniref:hypothetical protein n=1 Tax=Parapedobacter tibetensis TaxID=2972951 RepID=UPI00214D6D2F|nr:hypothetical protein [Parapedobacter tibetensis]
MIEFAFYFYMETLPIAIDLEGVKERVDQGETTWILAHEGTLNIIREAGIPVAESYEHPTFRITRLTGRFLNPHTHESACGKLFLIKI